MQEKKEKFLERTWTKMNAELDQPFPAEPKRKELLEREANLT